ncbi:MAG: NAD(P)/FAD-dependent oxidoreductase [Anaerolineales bacterium]|jgi:glycerol-3-phosphate dehydrogenase
MFDVAIIGAGVTGAAIARRLSSFKISVALFERRTDVSFGVSKANSGIIHAGFHHNPSTLKARLEVQGNYLFDRLKAELGFPFRRVGILVVAFSPEELKTVEALYEIGTANRVPQLEIVGRERILSLEPKLNGDAVGGLWAPTGGIVEPYRLVFALVENARANGVSLFTDWRVAAARRADDRWLLVSETGETHEARRVVNAAGLYADEVSGFFGAEEFHIIPRKGEEFLLDKNAAGFPSHVIFPVPARNSKGVLVIPTVEGTMMVGPTAVEIEEKDDTGTTPENLDRVFSLAARMVPGISKRDIITSFAGLRPTLPGDDFFIDLSRKAPGLVQVAGIQSPGLTAAPAIAEYVKGLLQQDGLKLAEKPDFVPTVGHSPKVVEMSFVELDELVRRERAFAHIVCRCESVSEAEVVEAIHKGHITLDGIKFYTRAGMGRCQGGFCTYRLLSIIARETGMRVEEITKRGKGSALVVGRIGDAARDTEVGSNTLGQAGFAPSGRERSGSGD